MRKRKIESEKSWVVYQTISNGTVSEFNSVCEQDEWVEMERLKPGAQSLVKGGFTNEGSAEREARGTAGDTKPRAK